MDDSTTRLGDCLTVLTDYHANGSYEMLRENVTLLDAPDYAVMIRTTNFENDDFVDGLKYINEHAYNFLAKSKVSPGDILMNKIASPGSVYRMPSLGRPVSLAMNLFLLRTDETRLDQAYAYYWLKANEAHVKSFACGAATATITKKAVRELEIPLPSLSVQRRVAGVLIAYDDLIENSQRRIRKLEAMARTLYRERLREGAGAASAKSILETDYWKFISANVSAYEGTKRYYATADVEGLTIVSAGVNYSFSEKPSRAQKQPTPFSVWFARMADGPSNGFDVPPPTVCELVWREKLTSVCSLSPGLLGGPAAGLLCAWVNHASRRRWTHSRTAQGRVMASKIARTSPEPWPANRLGFAGFMAGLL